MKKYYKIISSGYPFAMVYHIKDTANVPIGKTFCARPPYREGAYIQSDTPVIHFCDNAFDTMLWCRLINDSDNSVYEIKPLGRIIKTQCTDDKRLYQCGSEKIEFVQRISFDTLYERAMQEFNTNRESKTKMYPDLKIPEIITDFIKEQKQVNIY